MSDKPTKLELVANAGSDDPYDLGKLRVDQSFLETTTVKKLLTTVPIRKPLAQDFVRVHPALDYRDRFATIELKEDRERYVVSLAELPELQTECRIENLVTAITRTGVLFLWPVPVPAVEGRSNEWHVSAALAAQQAMTKWIRLKANMNLGAYEIFQAESTIPEPIWPEMTFQDLTRIAFRERLIVRPDHPVIKRLRGG